jgi:hypothetical protein
MTAKDFSAAIAADGVFVFPHFNRARTGVFEVAGTFGGGTVSPGYDDGAGNFVPFRDAAGETITATASVAWEVTLPNSGKLALTLAGATTPAIAAKFKLLS